MAGATKGRASRKDALAELRTLIGLVRSRGLKRGDRERAYYYRTHLQRALLNARANALRSSPAAFFAAVDELTKLEAPRVARQPVDADYLQQLVKAESLPIEQEVRWIAARIRYESGSINSYLERAREIEAAFINQDHEAALETVINCEEIFGISLWSTELKLALTQATKGLEAQKSILKQIRTVRRTGIWPFVANAASTRAEPAVSISWFLEESKRRQARAKKNEFSDYIVFRALGEWPEGSAAAARILRTEQSHHVIDLYETFVSYLQDAVTGRPTEQLSESISACLSELECIRDVRLRKLDFAVRGMLDKSIPVISLEAFDAVLSGASLPVVKRLQRQVLRRTLTTEVVLSLALSTSHTTLAEDVIANSKLVPIRGLAEALRRRGHQTKTGGRASERFKKLVHMYRGIPCIKSQRAIFDAAIHPNTYAAARHLQIAALNSSSWGFLDLLGLARNESFEKIKTLFDHGSAVAFASELSGRFSDSSLGLVRADALALARSTSLLLTAKSDAAANVVSAAVDSEDRVIASQAATVALNAYARTGDTDLASALIAREHVDHGVDPETMPVRDVYQDLEWDQMKSAAGSPELSIALSLIQSTEGDDKLKTYRRFALETLLGKFRISKPSELRSIDTRWSHSSLVYLLDKVCTAAMLDMLPAIRSTREVLEERREICGYLAALDKEGSDRHRLEVLEISRELTVLDGLRTIDGSRVHVDQESLSRRLRGELAESYQRYTSLLKDDADSIEGFATVLKDIGLGSQAPDYIFAIPVSEADELLVSMLLRCREQFLFNVPHGLDSYISKRIRHGSIVGVVRAPAEREGIVAKRNLDGTYRPGGTLADSIRDSIQRTALAAAIATTSKAIDQHLIRLRDTLLHVKSDSKPHGLLDAQLTAPGYLLIRSVASGDTSLDSFIETMFDALWGMLGAPLLYVQSLLKKDSVSFVSDQIQALRAKAQKILKDPDERAAFDAAAVAASVGMQSALAAAANWFEPTESASRSYSLSELVYIAVESVRATTTGFTPKLHIDGNATFSFSESVLPLICDVFYIAFGNVAAHGPRVEDPGLWVQVDRDANEPYLRFSIENALGEMSPDEHSELQRRVEAIRAEIGACHGVTRARSEGGSGLHKLASMVAQSEGQSLEFAVTDDRFRLCIRLRYSPEEVC
jgi:hypothetical protein